MGGVMVVVKKNGYFGDVGCGACEVVDDGCVGCGGGDDGCVGCGVGCEEAELARIA